MTHIQLYSFSFFFFFNDTATTEIYTLSLHDALPIFFLFNFLWSLFFGDRVEEHNPWRATTLEWSMASPPPRHDFGAPGPVVYRGAYAFAVPGVAQDYIPQHVAPDRVVKAN